MARYSCKASLAANALDLAQPLALERSVEEQQDRGCGASELGEQAAAEGQVDLERPVTHGAEDRLAHLIGPQRPRAGEDQRGGLGIRFDDVLVKEWGVHEVGADHRYVHPV